jgi:two-component system nitrate/nitrite sensor histidine kinase NarX
MHFMNRVRKRGTPGVPPGGTFRWLQWVTIVVPAAALFLYETVRHSLLEAWLPTTYGNIIVGVLALALTYSFSTLVFGHIKRLHAVTVAQMQEVAALHAMAEERERLSRELHDGLAQVVASVLIRIDTISTLLATQRHADALAELERLRIVADDLYADIRESLAGLRSQVAERGLLPPLYDYIEQFEEQYGIAVDVHDAPLAAELPPLTSFHLLRILQEALTNVRKHAEAHHAMITFAMPRPGMLQAVVSDDGRGFVPPRETGAGERSYGLAIMHERAASVCGTVQIVSDAQAGTEVVVTVPTRLPNEVPA